VKHVGVVVIAVVLALCSCKKGSKPRALSPPTVAEAETFAKDLATKLAPCDAAAIDRVVDIDLLIARTFAGRPADFDMNAFKRGLGTMGNMLCKQLDSEADAKVTYLRTPEVAGAPRPLLRLVSAAGVNYYQLDLDKQKGTIKLADFYIFVTGENISDTLGRMVDAIGKNGLSSAPKLKEIRQHMQAGRWQEAQTLLESLPAGLRAAKPMQLAAVQIASELGDEAYLKALNVYTKEFPNDPSLALVAIDRAILRKEYDVAIKYMTELDARVGGDPYLDVLKAGTLSMAGRHDEALVAAKRATEREPTLVDGWWQLLTVQAALKQHSDALPTIETLRDKFAADVATNTLAGDERFGALVESPEYVAWAAKQ
jgi:tetratricopeptide (TPR) repeat protein